MDPIEFYDVKARQKVSIPVSSVQKTKYERQTKDGATQVRYAVRAKSASGGNLTKFVSKDMWDKLDVAVV